MLTTWVTDRHHYLEPRHVGIIIMSIFILGASGYIGGSVLVGLKRTFATHNYVALVRNEKNIPAIEGMSRQA
jgi:nucleoside-diphosphate-sugar epimerase